MPKSFQPIKVHEVAAWILDTPAIKHAATASEAIQRVKDRKDPNVRIGELLLRNQMTERRHHAARGFGPHKESICSDKKKVCRWVLIVAYSVAVVAAEPENRQQAAIAKQKEAILRQRESAASGSIAQQLESVRRQRESAGTIRSVSPVEKREPECSPLPPSVISREAAKAAEKEGLTPDLLRAIIGKESSFRPCAVSPKGAMGLMQLMPETARALGVSDPFDPRQNIAAGSKFMRQLLDRYGQDLTLALGAYNAGPRQVDRYQGLPPFVETIDYVRDIMAKLP